MNSSTWSTVIYAGVGSTGLYFTSFDMTGTKEGRPVEIGASTLSISPNPALDRAVISYNQAVTQKVRISISDVTGREVADICPGITGPGQRSTVWNCGKVAAGVYLIRVETGNHSQTGRVVVSH